MIPGSMILLGGEPGIGKSTLVLQFALLITVVEKCCMYPVKKVFRK